MFVGTYTSTWRSPRRTRSVRTWPGAQQALRHPVDGGLCRNVSQVRTARCCCSWMSWSSVVWASASSGAAVDDRHVPAADRHPVGEDELGEPAAKPSPTARAAEASRGVFSATK